MSLLGVLYAELGYEVFILHNFRLHVFQDNYLIRGDCMSTMNLDQAVNDIAQKLFKKMGPQNKSGRKYTVIDITSQPVNARLKWLLSERE